MKIIADINIPSVKECFSHLGEVITVTGREITPDLLKDADVLLVRSITKVNEKLLKGSSVKFVATATIGVDHIDREYLKQAQIGFSSAPGSNATSVAEYIVAALLNIAQANDIKLSDSSIGIIGVGNVGSRVERRAAALGMKIVLNDPPLQRASLDKKYRPLEEALDCDFVTLHTPLEKVGADATYHLCDRLFFEQLKEGAVLLNSSRGAVVETEAIKAALESGKLSGACLDVWEYEPKVDIDLLNAVDIATPHIAGYSFDGKIKGLMMIYRACCQHFGITPDRSIDEFLTAAAIETIDYNEYEGNEQEILEQIVSSVYNILDDDSSMLKLSIISPEKRAEYFDRLRKEYRVRREFSNTTIINAPKNIAQTLEGIGFKCSK